MTEIKSELILSSISAYSGTPLYTFVLTYPRCILAEFNTHRMLSRNTASSRAIPTRKMRERVITDPFVPVHIGQNKKGMQAGEPLTGRRRAAAVYTWRMARYGAVAGHWMLERLGVHKEIANRLVEPWLWVEQVVTGTDFENLFKLRCSPDAEPHFRMLAEMLRKQMQDAKLSSLYRGQWHLPFVTDHDRAELEKTYGNGSDTHLLKKVSAARCARVSYKSVRPNTDAAKTLVDDLALANRLSKAGHWSPFEHQATPTIYAGDKYIGNFRGGWKQFRKEFQGESGADHSIFEVV